MERPLTFYEIKVDTGEEWTGIRTESFCKFTTSPVAMENKTGTAGTWTLADTNNDLHKSEDEQTLDKRCQHIWGMQGIPLIDAWLGYPKKLSFLLSVVWNEQK